MKFKDLIIKINNSYYKLNKEAEILVAKLCLKKEFKSISDAMEINNLKNNFRFYLKHDLYRFLKLMDKYNQDTKNLQRLVVDYLKNLELMQKSFTRLNKTGLKNIYFNQSEIIAESDFDSRVRIHFTRNEKKLYVTISKKDIYVHKKFSPEFRKFSRELRLKINEILEENI
jgi:hypothetical protein